MAPEYYIRDKLIKVEEVRGILAVKIPAPQTMEEEEVVKRFGRQATEQLKIDEKEREVFTKAGWRFVLPTEDVTRSKDTRAAPEGATFVGRVFIHPRGHTLIGTNRITVRLNESFAKEEVQEILREENLEVVRELKFASNLFEVRVQAGEDFLETSVRLHNDSRFVFAEPQMIMHIPQRFTPTDPNYNQQWHLENDGTVGGTVGADISAENAWDSTRGSGIRIAVIDNGFDVSHPDLSAAIASGTGYFEDDGAGGADFKFGTTNYPDDDHGTFCAGMAVAKANNAEGSCGIANQAQWLAVACLVDQTGTQTTLARAIAYAADPTTEDGSATNAADVIACSLGPNGANYDMENVLQLAIDAAVTNGRGGLGTPVFWATSNGNFNINQDDVVSYQNVIAVGRSNWNDLADGSAFGDELDFLATGRNVYSTMSGGGYGYDGGTSFAAPLAAGVGALVLSIDPDLTWDDVRDILRATCDQVGGVVYDINGHHDDYGFGRINAERAVCRAGHNVERVTQAIAFNDVPEGEPAVRAVVFETTSCPGETFRIISGPTVTTGPPNAFGTPLGTTVTLPPNTDITATRYARLWISYTGTNAGDTAEGTVRVRHDETGDEWDVPITANTIAKPTEVIMLVLDKSGSMDFDSGLGDPYPKRIDILKFAAMPFIELLPPDDAIGIVSFDHNAYDVMSIEQVGAELDGAGRNNARTAITNHTPNPEGATSIGDGVEKGHQRLDPVTGYDHKVSVVFTDGHENREKLLSEVSHLIDERVFAIGLGSADTIRPAALDALTDNTGGYLLLTGEIGDQFFRLSKYFLQILAGVTNKDIVLDPEGMIIGNEIQRIPFVFNETDRMCDIIVVTPTPTALTFKLEAPNGDIIDPNTAEYDPSMEYICGSNVCFYRMTLPAQLQGGEARDGTWHALLSIRTHEKKVDPTSGILGPPVIPNLNYCLNVHTLSSLKASALMFQSSYEPGAELILQVMLTEYGLPVEERARLEALILSPNGIEESFPMEEIEPGVFETGIIANIPGIYRFRVKALGRTFQGLKFTREIVQTGAVWRGGDRLPPKPPSGVNRLQRCCLMLKILLTVIALLTLVCAIILLGILLY